MFGRYWFHGIDKQRINQMILQHIEKNIFPLSHHEDIMKLETLKVIVKFSMDIMRIYFFTRACMQPFTLKSHEYLRHVDSSWHCETARFACKPFRPAFIFFQKCFPATISFKCNVIMSMDLILTRNACLSLFEFKYPDLIACAVWTK